jgi:L-ascorbate metabolism protein UlaG (beta-lactamase superfamily)
MMPEQTAQAALDLKTKVLMPVHWSKFTLALHPWNESIKRVTAEAQKLNLPFTTPMIGEPIFIDSIYPSKLWWEEVL